MNIQPFKIAAIACLFILSGCGKSNASPGKGLLTLDWKPEPEFGGFYAAQAGGIFARHGLTMEVKPAGGGADIWQLVATGQTEFATTAADQVLIARKSGADVIAIFAVYQTFPQGIMVHEKRGFKSIADVFSSEGVLEVEPDTWLTFLRKRLPNPTVKISASYSGGIATFLADPNDSQQCFVTSEPILARRQGSDPKTFLIADEGYNPYTTVVICRGDLWKSDPQRVKEMVAACREGWAQYLADPTSTNAVMHGINGDMDLQTFADAAEAQKPLIDTEQTRSNGLGTMTAERWIALAGQLRDLGVTDGSINPADCFVNP